MTYRDLFDRITALASVSKADDVEEMFHTHLDEHILPDASISMYFEEISKAIKGRRDFTLNNQDFIDDFSLKTKTIH